MQLMEYTRDLRICMYIQSVYLIYSESSFRLRVRTSVYYNYNFR